MSKQTAIADARAAHAELLAAVEGLDDAALSTVFVGEWGVKHVIAHIGGWQRLNGAMMERMARGEHPIPAGENYDDDDAMNAGFAAEAAAGSGPDAVRALRASFERFISAAAALPEERFEDGRFAGQMLAGNGVTHVREHIVEIAAYRATLS
jgi:Mycothiol maleylpyruvate isomerase N-terminal domain